MRSDDNVARKAATRQGLATAPSMLALGLSTSGISRRAIAGRLDHLHRNVYRVAGAPETWEQLELAACLTTGGPASHRAALPLWEVDLPIDIPLEVSVTRPHAPRPQGVIVHRSLDLDPAHIVTRNGIPVTNPMRMLVDLGAVVDEYWVARALEKAIVKKLVTLEGVKRFRDEVGTRGRRGAGVLRRVLDDWTLGSTRPDSVLEPAFGRLCRKYGVPMPVFQQEVIIRGRRYRIDFAFPDLMIAIEIDGFDTRTDLDVFKAERWRQNALALAGWTVVRFTWHDMLYRPEYVAATILSVLGKQIPG